MPLHESALPEPFALVHGAIAHWARERPDALALANESCRLSFAQLHARVQAQVRRLDADGAPATVLLPGHASALDAVVGLLGIIASGRCAAMGDAQWPDGVAQAMAARLPQGGRHDVATPLSPFYIGFTSGSTGLPKGFMRHHRSWVESFRVSLRDFGPAAATRVLAPGRMSHSLFLFGALLGLWTGAGAVLQERFSAPRALDALTSGATPQLVAVPSQLVLLLEYAERRRLAPIEGVELVLISGARWLRERTPALRQLFPRARIVEFYGASEASYIAWMDADPTAPAQAVGRPFSNVQLHIGPHPHSPPLAPGQPGLIWVRSPMLFMDYVNPGDATAALRVGDWLSVRDFGYLDANGLLHLCGRENRMLVTQGKNLFPEEVEARLLAHGGVVQASLQGLADGLRGARVHAVLQCRDGVAPPPAQDLAAWCRAALEPFKAPRHWWLWRGDWPQTASGKTDHAAIGRALATGAPALRAWP
ncbi:MAG: AMP-binding protein [Proteobacteria bacterium]|nr:AMP-binding protein [Pseudomonadota bacterium]